LTNSGQNASPPPPDRIGSVAWAGAFAGLAWVGGQLVLTLVAISTDAPHCLRDLHEAALVITMAGAAAAGIALGVLTIAGRTRGALIAFGTEAVFALTWLAAGGLDSASCAFGV
jgi:hypothetical protein